ncbi:protein C10 isoform X2 [Tachypleus tridentatus]|uniref:protein C10 isoform X2 n=1 Tax=Tachypleus tridentatus TaxID=6853 RepID=UPI003FD17085
MAAVSEDKEFTVEKAKVILEEILAAFNLPDNINRLDEARDNAGNDMLKHMQLVFPVATQIEIEVIQNYGFPPNGEGCRDAVMNKSHIDLMQWRHLYKYNSTICCMFV